MSLAGWYHHKADQSARLAKQAHTRKTRACFASEQIFWRRMAAKLDKKSGFGKEPK